MSEKVTYWGLIRDNPDYRKLWMGQLVSNLGDWFNVIAVYNLVFILSGTGTAVAGVLIAKTLPHFFVAPYSGVIIDRFDRKKIMVASDLIRGVLVLGLIFIRKPEHLWILYSLLVLQVVFAAFFEPARTAVVPNITKREELVAANALAGSTWSAMLAFGAAAGGMVTALLGRNAAFLIDSATFFVSAAFIWRISSVEGSEKREVEHVKGGGFSDIVAGLRYIRKSGLRAALILTKSGVALAAGLVTLFPIYAEKVVTTPLMSATSALGFIFAARGTGAFLGPILVRKYFGETPRVMRRAMAGAFFILAFSYFGFSKAPDLWSAAAFGFTATLGGAVVWVFSTTLAHMEVEDRFRGRFFALEFGLFTALFSLSSWAVGWGLDNTSVTPRGAAELLSFVALVPAIGWIVFLFVWKKKDKRKPLPASWCPLHLQEGCCEVIQLPPSELIEGEE